MRDGAPFVAVGVLCSRNVSVTHATPAPFDSVLERHRVEASRVGQGDRWPLSGVLFSSLTGTLGKRRLVVACLAVATMVLGSIDLASAPPALADANPPPGYHTVTVEKAGVSFVVPDTWTKLDPTSPLFADTMKQATDANPDLAALFEGFDPSQLTFFAIDSKGTFFASNVLVNPTMLEKSNLSDPPNRIKSQLNLGPTFQDVQVHRTKVGRSRAIAITGPPL